MSQLSPEERAQIRRLLADLFNLSEMKNLAFDLGVDYEEFAHNTPADFSRELIAYFERQNKMGCLITEMARTRPTTDFTSFLAAVPACNPNQKVQLLLSNDQIKSRPDLKQKLAELLGIATEEVMIIATAAGSLKVLLGLPADVATQLGSLPLPYQLDSYEIIGVTPFPKLPSAAQLAWQSLVVPVTATTTAVSSGIILGSILKWVLGLLVVTVIGIGGGLIGWRQTAPTLRVVNQCSTTLRFPDEPLMQLLLSLPEELEPGAETTIFVLTGSGTYEYDITRQGTAVLKLPTTIPLLNIKEIELGEATNGAIGTLDGDTINPPQRFQLESNQTHELIICAPSGR
jgi:hypothetical protein